MSKHDQCIVIGSSYGGIEALSHLLPAIKDVCTLPILVTQHIKGTRYSNIASCFSQYCACRIYEAEHSMLIEDDCIYFAPPDYHMLVSDQHKLILSADERVNYSRPSIDELFETASETYQQHLIAIILTGANQDGANGIRVAHQHEGFTIAQEPKQAKAATMPQAAIDTGHIDAICRLENIASAVKAVIERGCNDK